MISTAFACVLSSAFCAAVRFSFGAFTASRTAARVAGVEVLQPLVEELFAERVGERGQPVLRRLDLPVDQFVAALSTPRVRPSCRPARRGRSASTHRSGL